MPHTSAIVAADMDVVDGREWQSARPSARPAFSVSVGVTRQESWTKSEWTSIFPCATARSEGRDTSPVSSSAASPVTAPTRPVRSA